jgi:hypothetical protein
LSRRSSSPTRSTTTGWLPLPLSCCFYAQSSEGMVQADGTGFFDDEDLILELD